MRSASMPVVELVLLKPEALGLTSGCQVAKTHAQLS